MNRSLVGRWVLTAAGVATLFYALLVLGYAATAPDIALRFLLVENDNEPGPVIRAVLPHKKNRGPTPEVGDRLLAMGPSKQERVRMRSTPMFLHVSRTLQDLRGDVPPGNVLPPKSDPSELPEQFIEPFVEIEGDSWLDRERLVEVMLQRPGDPEPIRTWLQIQSIPLSELGLPLVWFLLEVGIFAVGAVAFWTRPFDRSARAFFAMCIVTVGAFVGGYHWWIIAGNLWLNVPFAIFATLVPAVTLHFFLIFPTVKSPLLQRPRLMLTALYTVPGLAILAIVGLLLYCGWYVGQFENSSQMIWGMRSLQRCIQGYLLVAAGYFLMTLWALINSFLKARNPLQQNQVKWILWAAVAATIPVCYSLYLTQFDRVAFSIGKAALPMFFASLVFMLAYAVAIARHKLMLVDQIFSPETLYLGVGALASAGYSGLVALASLVAIFQQIRSFRQALVVSGLLMLAIILFGWLRGRLQLLIDRRFFREKYQLDKALQQMNQMSGQLANPEELAERMLHSCEEVLLVGRAALYVLDAELQQFRLVAAGGDQRVPVNFPALTDLMEVLRVEHAVQRVNGAPPEIESPVQRLMQAVDACLIQALEVNGVVEGAVLLGEKRSGADYTAEDLTFLTAMGQVASVAMHSAQVHQIVARLNEELQAKVAKIGEQQRQISMLQAEITTSQLQARPPAGEPAEGEAATAEPEFRHDNIRGSSPSMVRLLDTVRKVASSEASVLIRGESGTGKELLAEAIHQNSPRRSGPLIKVHCGALAPGLLESELFGHVKGAFTGAHRDKVGRFELANGGTLFLDEIGDISLETQIKLLRVLQEREFEPVGSTRTTQVDVRLITATHQNLERLMSEGKFREDLYYRLNVISITPPPLRERKDDIFELALHFMTRAASRLNKSLSEISPEALDALLAYSWPGNIRELENVIERAVVLADQGQLMLRDLPGEVVESQSWDAKPAVGRSSMSPRFEADRSVAGAGKLNDNQLERERLQAVLRKADGNKAQAARMLGVPRSTFFSKLKKHGLD